MMDTQFKHTPYALGYKMTKAEVVPYRVQGKRRWYAPWLRHPDKWVTPPSQEEIMAILNRVKEDAMVEIMRPSPFFVYLQDHAKK